MKKIPIVLEQYECIGCKYKWYINTEDKAGNEMMCPYGCECSGSIIRKFNMMIHNYEEYIQSKDITPSLDGVDTDDIEVKGGNE